MRRVAVFSCLGLGDGLISLVLSNNLLLNGAQVTTFHPFLSSLQTWFPSLPILPFPKDIDATLEQFDRFFLFYEKSPRMQEILNQCLAKHRNKLTVLNPIATPKQNYPYWEEGRFDGEKPFADNLYHFTKQILKFNVSTKSNGILPPEELTHRAHKNRILFHPTSSREGKNWSPHKYLALRDALKKEGYQPRFLLTKQERVGWNVDEKEAPLFPDLKEVAAYIYESGSLIGNDSGMGHLASCLGIPTLTICRNQQSSQFWRPAWAPGAVIYPSSWVPNMKGLRLRDKQWKKWISVKRALRAFHELSELCNQGTCRV